MIRPDAKLVQCQDFVVEHLEGEIVLYHEELKKMVYLNESASVVWQLCDGQRSVGDIIGLVEEAYPEIVKLVAVEVNDAIETLVSEGVLLVAPVADA